MDRINALLDSTSQLYFPLKKYGYVLEKTLNNKNRWDTKMVCSIRDENSKRYVSTTYADQNEYLKLLKITTYLKRSNKISPDIVRLCPEDKTVVCDYTGEFLHDYLLSNPAEISLTLSSVFDYLKDINSINQSHQTFVTPSIIKTALQFTTKLNDDLEFLPRVKRLLPKLENLNVKFSYGCGIEDPHSWNFRIVRTKDKIQALTTDFDYFSYGVNYFWKLGYFYATLRWFKKIAFSLACTSEQFLLSLIQDNGDLKSEFMFWLGVLSSYCGYKDSLMRLMISNVFNKLREEYRLIQQLDEKVSCLASKILVEQEYIEHNTLNEALITLK
ncbi:MAG: hypothetical protein ISS45_06945 [Candidatus Omnitrophica bacterium]|nr:hypothetical protein [Candidatus Omnitrophota bacterium]